MDESQRDAVSKKLFTPGELMRLEGVRQAPAANGQMGVARVCRLVHTKRDAAALLILRDADDDVDCPRPRGPETAEWVRAEQLAFDADGQLRRPAPFSIAFVRYPGERLAFHQHSSGNPGRLPSCAAHL